MTLASLSRPAPARRLLLAVAALVATLFGPIPAAGQCPPQARTDKVVDDYHGTKVVDPYRWLEDAQSPATRAWISAENQCTRKALAAWPGLAALKERLGQLMKVDSIGVPTERGGRYFYTRRRADQDQAVLYQRRGLAGAEEVLVDPNPLSPDHSVSVSLEAISDDGTLVAYSLRQGGEDETAIHFLNTGTRQELPDQLPRARYFTVALTTDNSGYYYTRMDKEGPRVLYHALGAPGASDKLIFGEGYGAEFIIVANISDDGRFLVIQVLKGSAADKTEIYYQDLAARGKLQTLVKDVDARFFAQEAGGRMFIHTNWQAPNNRVLAADLDHPECQHWREVVPEGKSVIDSLSLAGSKLLVSYTENASSRVAVYDAAGKREREVALPMVGRVFEVTGRWQSQEAFYSFTSFPVPPTVYRLDLASGAQSVFGRIQVPLRSEDFEVRQVWYASRDGTRIPMFVLHRRGLKLDGSSPALLTGYGGFNISETPYFSYIGALWAMSGGVFAVANLRGGGEFGEAWHKAGMFEHKQNVFDDFIAAAEFLVASKYTNPAKLAITGRSNGGLLVMAATMQRPDLFRAVLCMYPLIDMLRYQNFLVAKYWVSEYGSSDDPGQFPYLYAYSPYHHVKEGEKYPAIMFLTGDGDTRVDPLHARKMAARMQAVNGSPNPILIRYDTEAGHSQGLPISQQIDEYGDALGFLYWQLGIPAPQ
jgi:prolyl oligopeptidase